MYATKETNYNVVDGTPYGKDVVKGLADACARNGLKFGVYYSTIDWHYPDATTWTADNNNEIPDKHADFNVRQIRELMSGYGPLAEIWFDMGKPTPEQSKRFADAVHALQPDCMVSGRVFNYQGDFSVMGDNSIPQMILDEPWETPAALYSDTWGYRVFENRTGLPAKIGEQIVKLVQVVSRGGNYLLNIGPRGDGSIVEFESSILRGVGAWLNKNGEAIYGSKPQPFRSLPFGYATVKPGRLYLMVQNWPADGDLRLTGLKTKLRKAYFLADSEHSPLAMTSDNGVTVVHIEHQIETPPVTVVVCEFDGPLVVVPPAIPPGPEGMVTLTAADARTYYNYNGRGYYDPPAAYKHQWDFQIARAGKYRVSAVYKSVQPGARLQFDFPEARIDTPASESTVGMVDLKMADSLTLTVSSAEPFRKGNRLGADLDRVTLTPVN
jgi:alpha-L-fucosidase